MRRATPPCVRKLPARMKNGIAMISKLSRPVNSFIDTAFDRDVGEDEQERQHGQAERDRDRHAGDHERDQQDEDRERAQRLRQHDNPGLVREAYRQNQNRRQDQGRAPAAFAQRLETVAVGVGRRGAMPRSRRCPRRAPRCGAANCRSSRTTTPPAGSGSTSAPSRAESRNRSSTSAIRDRSTAGRS